MPLGPAEEEFVYDLSLYKFKVHDGSDVSLCDRRLLEQLGLEGVQRRFTLTTLSSDDKEQSGLEVSLKASSLDGNESLSLPRVWSVDRIPVSDGSIAMPDDVKRWPHRRVFNLPQIDERRVMLLIGGDCPDAFWVLDERRGHSSEPYAVKFPLGGTLLGPVGPNEVQMNNSMSTSYALEMICSSYKLKSSGRLTSVIVWLNQMSACH